MFREEEKRSVLKNCIERANERRDTFVKFPLFVVKNHKKNEIFRRKERKNCGKWNHLLGFYSVK